MKLTLFATNYKHSYDTKQKVDIVVDFEVLNQASDMKFWLGIMKFILDFLVRVNQKIFYLYQRFVGY